MNMATLDTARPTSQQHHSTSAPQTLSAVNPQLRIDATRDLLELAWRCAAAGDVSIVPADIKTELQKIAEKHPAVGQKALDVFEELETFFNAASNDPQPDWLRTALQPQTVAEVSFRLTPTAILVYIPDTAFRKISPTADGIAVFYPKLPDSLRGRIIVLPDSGTNRGSTLTHEIIHTLQQEEPNHNMARKFSCSAAEKIIRQATSAQAVAAEIARMGEFPRLNARREVVAYIGSGDPAPSLEPYGVRIARRELDAVLFGLALNQNLAVAEKRTLFKQANLQYQESLRYAATILANFEKLATETDLPTAVAQTLAQGFEGLEVPAHRTEKAAALLSDFREILPNEQKSVPSPSRPFFAQDRLIDLLKKGLRMCPDPEVIPLILETMPKTSSPLLQNLLIEVLERAIESDPHQSQPDAAGNWPPFWNCLPKLFSTAIESSGDATLIQQVKNETVKLREKGIRSDHDLVAMLHTRISKIADGSPYTGLNADAAKCIAHFIARVQDMSLFKTPFDRADSKATDQKQSTHPYILLAEALKHDADASQLLTMLCDIYPHRHPVWKRVPSTEVLSKVRSLSSRSERIDLWLALAAHSSDHSVVAQSVTHLSDFEDSAFSDTQKANLKRIVHTLPAAEQLQLPASLTHSRDRYGPALDNLKARFKAHSS